MSKTDYNPVTDHNPVIRIPADPTEPDNVLGFCSTEIQEHKKYFSVHQVLFSVELLRIFRQSSRWLSAFERKPSVQADETYFEGTPCKFTRSLNGLQMQIKAKKEGRS
jgi:hypothetical protein